MSAQITVHVAGSERAVAEQTTPADLFGDDRAVVVARVNGELRDLSHPLAEGDTVEPVRVDEEDGLSVLREMARLQSSTRVVVLTAAVSDDDVLEAIRLGIRGLVLKESAPRALVECVRRVHAGGQYIEPRFLTRALDAAQRRDAGHRELTGLLTPRELQVLRMVAGGLRNRAIAQQLEISEGTVKIHLHNIYEKVDVENRVELALLARAKGYV